MKKTTVWISIIPFLFLIFGGMLWGILKADRPYSDTENRYLAARPAFSWKSLFRIFLHERRRSKSGLLQIRSPQLSHANEILPAGGHACLPVIFLFIQSYLKITE